MRAIITLTFAASVQGGLLSDLSSLKFPGMGSGQQAPAPTPISLPTTLAQSQDQPMRMIVDPEAQMAAEATALEEMDLLCVNGPQAQAWFTIQQKMRYILPPEAAFGQVSKDLLEPALYSIMEDMASLSLPNQDTCGIGKLLIQLLSVVTADDTGSNIAGQMKNEPLTSPMLTLLLDIPWQAFQPMWPVFGFYAQLAMRRVRVNQNDPAIDGILHPDLQQFAAALNYGIVNGDLDGLQQLATAYLETGGEGVQESPMAFVTALFTQAATTQNKEEAQELFRVAQGVLKKMIHSPEDLDLTFSSRWPIWGMAYLASLNAAV